MIGKPTQSKKLSRREVAMKNGRVSEKALLSESHRKGLGSNEANSTKNNKEKRPKDVKLKWKNPKNTPFLRCPSGSLSDSSASNGENKKNKKKEVQKKSSTKKITKSAIPANASHVVEQRNPQTSPAKNNKKPSITANARFQVLYVDLLPIMKKGCPFLKYGQRGYPHFRQFQLSQDHTKIIWFTRTKKIKDSQVSLLDINEIVHGQTTSTFNRYRVPELKETSLSIIYGGHQRKTLDIIAKDPNDYQVWCVGLKRLHQMVNEGQHSLQKLTQLTLNIKVEKGRRTTSELVDVNTGKTADDIGYPRQRLASSSNKQMHKGVSNKIKDLKKKLKKKRKQLRNEQYYQSEHYESMTYIIKKIEDSLSTINQRFPLGEYVECDNEVWRANVDVEALTNMMEAIRNSS